MAVYEYGEVLLVFEVRGLVDQHPDFKFKVLNEYYTTEGMITDGKFFPRHGGKPEPLGQFDAKVTPGGAWGSFLHAVRSRRVADLNADVEHGHYSAALCHLANISYRLGERFHSIKNSGRSAAPAKSRKRSRTCAATSRPSA